MKNHLLFTGLLLFIIIFSPIALALTGNAIFSTNPNDLQKIYSKSSPAIAKINVYYDYDIYLPELNSIDFRYDFDYEYPLYEDLNVKMDESKEGFDSLFGDSFWNKFYVGEYYYSDEFGDAYTYELNAEEIKEMKKEFDDYHNSAVPLLGGTGFLISSEGYLLTNAHVATLLDSEMDYMEEFIISSNYLDYYYYLYENANYNDEISVEEYEDLLKKIMFLEENMEIRNIKISRIEVILGDGSNIKKYDAKLIDYNENYLDENGGRDWALLKISGEVFASLPMGDSDNIQIGEDITVIGYPWTSEGITEKKEVYVSSTPTTGKVSNIIPSGKYMDIQIDVSIENGNSGGPGLNSEGEVIGIATAGYQGLSGQYNYLTPINDIKKEIDATREKNEINTLWNEGLESFWNENYATSRLKFEEIESINPNHPYVKNILNQLKELPNTDSEIITDEDGSSDISNSSSKRISIVQTMFIVLGIAIVFLLTYIAINMKRGKN